jgi:hypothetical protein
MQYMKPYTRKILNLHIASFHCTALPLTRYVLYGSHLKAQGLHLRFVWRR